MKKKPQNHNQVTVIGVVGQKPVYSHKAFGERFYSMILHVSRFSEKLDEIPLVVSERLFEPGVDYQGRIVMIKGQFRSRNKQVGGHHRLILSVFAKSMILLSENAMDELDVTDRTNDIYLEGYVCREPIYRVTPMGKEISDVLLAVNRDFNKSDYLPCICWGRNAKYAERFKVGERVQMWGRVQSREYEKRTEDDRIEQKTAYEVSVERIEALEGTAKSGK